MENEKEKNQLSNRVVVEVFGLDKHSNVSSHFSSEWERVLIALDVNF